MQAVIETWNAEL